LIEGAGGWYAPISERKTMADLARAPVVPILLVVGLRQGCLNHALLPYNADAGADADALRGSATAGYGCPRAGNSAPACDRCFRNRRHRVNCAAPPVLPS
jgi:AAA domain